VIHAWALCVYLGAKRRYINTLSFLFWQQQTRAETSGLWSFRGWGAGPHLTQCGPGRGLPPYQVASWSIQPFGHNRHGPKSGGCCAPLLGRGAGSPSNTMSPGPRPTSLLSGIFIHPLIQPFGHNTHWPKTGSCAPLGEGQLGPHLKQCGQGRGLPARQVLSWSIQLFAHNTPTLQTRLTDRQDRQRSHSTWRTVLQTVAK